MDTIDTIELPSEAQLPSTGMTITEQDMIALFQRFITLQDQFTQLTAYVEKAFLMINSLQTVVHNKVLS